jgi:hypothetical protein
VQRALFLLAVQRALFLMPVQRALLLLPVEQAHRVMQATRMRQARNAAELQHQMETTLGEAGLNHQMCLLKFDKPGRKEPPRPNSGTLGSSGK